MSNEKLRICHQKDYEKIRLSLRKEPSAPKYGFAHAFVIRSFAAEKNLMLRLQCARAPALCTLYAMCALMHETYLPESFQEKRINLFAFMNAIWLNLWHLASLDGR